MKRWLILVVGTVIAYLILRYRRAVKDFVGDIGFAERILGIGGTNTFIVIMGILTFVLSLMYAAGTLQSVMQSVLGPFFGQ